MTELVQTLYEAIGGICPIAVRKPEQLRSIVEQLELEKKTAVSLTLFNDGIFGSETDLGTYGTEPRIDNSSNNRAWGTSRRIRLARDADAAKLYWRRGSRDA